MSADSYIRVPPDGAGKKIHTHTSTIGADVVETQVVHIAGAGTDQVHTMDVDNRGAAKVTFAEGPPSMDVFGNLRVAQSNLMASYTHVAGNLDELFYTETTGAGTIYYDTDNASMSLRNTNDVGSILRASNHYHHYQPGTGIQIIITGRLSDHGLVNNLRRWGYYDAEDGVFFQVLGTTFSVGVRKAGVDTLVDRANWNGDVVDGTGLSGMVMDITKINFCWIDFAWLGAGVVRFGVLGEDGQRIVCHTVRNPNKNDGPYMNSPDLPICFENINTGTTTTQPSLEFLCASVYAEAALTSVYKRLADIEIENVVISADTPIVSLRGNVYYPQTPNHTLDSTVFFLNETYIQSLNLYTTAPIYLELFKECTMSGVTWDIYGSSSLRGGRGGTLLADDEKEVGAWCLPSGFHNINTENLFDNAGLGIHTDFDNNQPVWSVIASNLTGETATVKMLSVTYKELR